MNDGGVRWLTGQERAAWLAATSLMVSLPAALDTRLQADAQLSYIEYMVLAVLSEQENRTLQLSGIAAGVAASLSRLSHVVTRLQARGLLTRSRVAGSGRRTTATLTEAGYAKVVAAAPDHVRAVREYFINALSESDTRRMQRIGLEVALRINPERPFLPGSP